MIPFKDLPIRRKLTRMSAVATASVLLLSCGAFVTYELLAFKATARQHLSADAEIIGINVAPALLFRDPAAAAETLAALRATPNVIAAAVYGLDRKLFARYVRGLGAQGLEIPADLDVVMAAHRAESDDLTVLRAIVNDGQPIGTVYIHSDLREIESRLQGYAGITGVVLVLSFGVAMFVSSIIERKISGPILSLAKTTRAVALGKDYSLRARVDSKDETGILGSAFNDMLLQIEAQNETLRRSDANSRELAEEVRRLNTGLEHRVAERTAELRESQEQLRAANLAKDTFLASMSHELRTPLNAIIGFTGTLLMKLPGPLNTDQEKQLKTVQASGRHLLSLINELLDLARIEAGKVDLKLEPMDCRGVVEDVVASLRPLSEAKGLRFELNAPAGELVVRTDRRVLSQIVLNLANNAIKFTDKGSVLVHLRARGDAIEIAVTDTGVGIRPGDQEKLFGAFAQVDVANRARHEGTGLGLHLSRKLAALVGGTITLQSEHGKGSTFTLRLERS